jgi:hypothetical protein
LGGVGLACWRITEPKHAQQVRVQASRDEGRVKVKEVGKGKKKKNSSKKIRKSSGKKETKAKHHGKKRSRDDRKHSKRIGSEVLSRNRTQDYTFDANEVISLLDAVAHKYPY